MGGDEITGDENVSSELAPSKSKLHIATNCQLWFPVIIGSSENVTSRLHCSTDQIILDEDDPDYETTIKPVTMLW